MADGGHDPRILAQQFEVVGDVAAGAAELAAHVRHHERDVEDMDLVGKDVPLELVRKHHDGVVGQGAANESRHGRHYIGEEALTFWGTRGMKRPTGGIDPGGAPAQCDTSRIGLQAGGLS